METISSGQTFLMKRILPAIWLVMVLFGGSAAAIAIIRGHANVAPAMLIGPLVILVFGFVLFRKLLWDLADQVKDGGDFLVVRRGSVEDSVQLSNVINVSMSQFTNPKRLTLRLRMPGKFGDEVVFIPRRPTFQLNPFARNAIAENLIQRVDRAREAGRNP
jgi:hypothetical protein